MKKVTFEIARPVREISPQWICFIHEINRIAKDEGVKKAPFGAPVMESQDVEHYEEATITHSMREVGSLEIGIAIFNAATERMAGWFLAASAKYDQANAQLIDGKHYGPDKNAGDCYSRKRAMAADAMRRLAYARDHRADAETIRNLEAELDSARYVGD